MNIKNVIWNIPMMGIQKGHTVYVYQTKQEKFLVSGNLFFIYLFSLTGKPEIQKTKSDSLLERKYISLNSVSYKVKTFLLI